MKDKNDKDSKVIDIFTKLKRLPKKPSYDQKTDACLSNVEEKGYCDCDLCMFKFQTAHEVMIQTSKLCTKFMKKTKTPVRKGDLLDIIILAGYMYESLHMEEDDNVE